MRKLKADEIECRVAQVTAKGCSLLLYKTARVDRAILDEVYGDLWQNDFKVIDKNMYGGIGIYNKELKEWLWRWDCGTESMTEKEKGQASDCFKRAGFKWGIGVELYSAPFIFVQCDTTGEKTPNGMKYKLNNPYVKYSVKEIGYSDNGEINKLVIVDDKGNVVYKQGSKITPSKKEDNKPNSQIKENGSTTPDINADFDLIQGLYEHKDTKSLEKYYKSYKESAKEIEVFKAKYAEYYRELLQQERKPQQ